MLFLLAQERRGIRESVPKMTVDIYFTVPEQDICMHIAHTLHVQKSKKHQACLLKLKSYWEQSCHNYIERHTEEPFLFSKRICKNKPMDIGT